MDEGEDDGRNLVVLDPARVVFRERPISKRRQGGGTQTKYTPALGLEICDVMAASSKGLNALCKERPHWPDFITIFHWRVNLEDFNRAFILAQRMRAALLMDEITTITDEAKHDMIEVDGRMLPNPVAVQRAKLRAEFRERVAKRLDPATWGDKTDVNVNVGYLPQDEAIRRLK